MTKRDRETVFPNDIKYSNLGGGNFTPNLGGGKSYS